ncbi:MAG: hypothetical protein ABW141_10725 [Candidatus Thiodiazotropha endolucinida]|nr:hypothetical protein [Candidatus Thiodiazotropha sp. (ex Lucina pensylvanica)]MBT3038315.1 hypothetical protein [Candidatus Thiodiazotropha sp. (ex Codakia orbicularis)]MBT3042140.1 hypothetical protein [Candidatus Thiodiazotropha sp. (ex Codakia orbicularis)]MBV2124517.1 hypothetical protein [Candidatus Thiodiazotropha taylori]
MAAMKVESTLDIYLQMDPELLLSRIGFLVWRYQVSRSRKMALSIVRHMEAICRHPDFDEPTISRCGYNRSLKHWRMLAGENHLLLRN